MSFVTASKNSFSVKAYVGDEKTLLAFNFSSVDSAKKLAGFTIFCQPPSTRSTASAAKSASPAARKTSCA